MKRPTAEVITAADCAIVAAAAEWAAATAGSPEAATFGDFSGVPASTTELAADNGAVPGAAPPPLGATVSGVAAVPGAPEEFTWAAVSESLCPASLFPASVRVPIGRVVVDARGPSDAPGAMVVDPLWEAGAPDRGSAARRPLDVGLALPFAVDFPASDELDPVLVDPSGVSPAA